MILWVLLAAAPVGPPHQAFEVGKAKGINFGFDDMEKQPGSYDPVGCVRPCVYGKNVAEAYHPS